MKKAIQRAILLAASAGTLAQAVDVGINVNVKHTVGGISTFDRSKFITVHSSHTSSDWTSGENFTDDLLADFVEGYDVYFGRDTGYIGWMTGNVIDEDPAMPGWAQLSGGDYSIENQGAYWRGRQDNMPYESRAQSDIVCAQFTPFWPGSRTMRGGWMFSTNDTPSEPFGSSTGNYMGHFLNHFYSTADNGNVGRSLPAYVEILNEPDYPLFSDSNDPMYGTATEAELFEYHNTVANQIRSLNTNVLIGGYCNAFPDLETDGFNEWQDEWKQFIDICGTNMDFYSIHTYDVYDTLTVRKGSNLEATLDMIEHYSHLKIGKPLPFVVSELGGRDRRLEGYSWRPTLWVPERDWMTVKSLNSMVMSYADRPHLVYKLIPFIMCKEEWQYDYYGYPHNWRLFRKANEPDSYTGEWVYSDYIRFYELWSDVKGTRVDITTSDPDIQVDAYVDGNRAYVILNSLNTEASTVSLSLSEMHGNALQSVREKNLYWNGSNVALDETLHAGGLSQVQLEAEGAAVLEYIFQDAVAVSETSDENKYYASSYFQYILAGFGNVFQINGVAKGEFGDAVLRLGMGRTYNLSKRPVLTVNGTEINVPVDFMGLERDGRKDTFRLLDIPVPYDVLQENNSIGITFPDTGGYITSLSLRARTFSSDVRGTGRSGSVITDCELAGSNFILSISNGAPFGSFDLMSADELGFPGTNWLSSLPGLQFNGEGEAIVTNPVAGNQQYFRVREGSVP